MLPAAHLFEYAVLRAVPRVEREEFVNVGVVLFCAGQRFLEAAYAFDDKAEARLRAFAGPDFDLAGLAARLDAIARVCRGGAGGGVIGQLPLAGRFRWLTAQRSTVVQTSAVHPGLCLDAAATLARLRGQLVG